MTKQTTYYFRASREPMGFGATEVDVCDPLHAHKTREEAEACPIRTRKRDGETISLDVITSWDRLEG